jgi:hypothetical protein
MHVSNDRVGAKRKDSSAGRSTCDEGQLKKEARNRTCGLQRTVHIRRHDPYCPHCGAVHEVTETKVAFQDPDAADYGAFQQLTYPVLRPHQKPEDKKRAMTKSG